MEEGESNVHVRGEREIRDIHSLNEYMCSCNYSNTLILVGHKSLPIKVELHESLERKCVLH